jgi:DNA-binding NarL/FixJ family response regulator
MDIEMPVLDGIATISSASIKYPEIKHIVLTIYADDDKIFEAIKAGASGYLLKEDKAINIVEAISNVVEFDGIPMSPAIARRAMELLREAPKPVVPVQNNPTESQLSDREMEILKEVVKGYNHQEIAEKLFISPNTVRTHVNNIYKKLHLNSRSQIMNLAYKNKWI